MDLKDYIKMEGNSGFLRLRIIPNAKNTELSGLMDNGVFKIRLKAIPEKGKANKELIDFISTNLGLKKSSIEVVSGLTDKNKLVKIDF